MNSSNEQLLAFANKIDARQDPGFISIVAFDYYDGPEQGLAIYPTGAGVRFSLLGESRSRLFRAFSFVTIDGNWLQRSKDLKKLQIAQPSQRIFLPERTSELLDTLEQDVYSALECGYYVGVGSSTLDWLSISLISNDDLGVLQKLNCPLDSFRRVHRLIKDQKRAYD